MLQVEQKKAKEVVEDLQVESEEEQDDEELAEDVFEVESICNHMVEESDGELKFEVKWKGYEKKSDRTWESEENLMESAREILTSYLEKLGGKDQLLAEYNAKKEEAQNKKKRGRQSNGTTGNGAKKAKKNGSQPTSASSRDTTELAQFKPPSGNWEDEVVGIDACEGGEGKVVVYLTWKNGAKSQHPLHQIYKRCPQKMLEFYERHLVFKRGDS